jgi:hypothetical protein
LAGVATNGSALSEDVKGRYHSLTFERHPGKSRLVSMLGT